jgi:hypothetical protein
MGGGSPHLDFMRLDPSGKFYLHRALQDDQVPDRVEPRTSLDPILVIIRVAEALAVGLAFVRALTGLETERELRRLGFAFRWTKLANRVLTTWANPMVLTIGEPQSHEDEATTYVELSSDTPTSALGPLVAAATRDLFALFDGEKIPQNVVEDWTTRLIERRL